MFDLFRSRTKAVRLLLYAMLGAVALSMVTYLIPGGMGGSDRSQDQVIAEIGKEPLTIQEFQQRMESVQRARPIPKGAAPAFAQQMLDQMISSEALAYEARRMGIVITDADLAKALRNIPQLFPNGQFVGKEQYAIFLQQQNLTIPDFESQLRQDLLVNRLSSLVADNVVVTPDEVTREYQRREQKVKLDYVALASAKFKDKVTIEPDEVRIYFNSIRAQFRTPEKRSFQMLVADAARVAQKISISDDELRRIYTQNKDQYRVPERVHVRHILLKTEGKQPADVAKVQAKADDVLKQLKGGANFADLARKVSEDPGSTPKGGDLGWIVRDQIPAKALENAAFSLKPNEISGVIKTEYGFDILQVLEKEEALVKPFEGVKDQIAQERKKQQVYDTMQKVADQAHDELVKHPQQAAEIASRLELYLVPIADAAAGQPIPVFGPNPDFSDAISSVPVGGVTPVLQAPGDRLAVAVVTGIKPSHQAELPEVEGQIRALLTRLKLSDTVKDAAKELMDKAKASGGDLAKAAQQMGMEVKTTPEFGPEGAAEGIGSATLLKAAFDDPAGAIFGPVAVGDQQFVCKVAAKLPADMSKFDAQKADIEAAVKERKQREQIELFIDSVRTALIRDGKIKLHQQVIDRALAASRG